MENNTQISPLIKDLKKLNLSEYLKSSSYERFLVKNKFNDSWQKFYNHSKDDSVFVIGLDMESFYCEEAFLMMLNYFFEHKKNIFFNFIVLVLTSYKEYIKKTVDLSEIVEDIEILSCPIDVLNELKKLGEDYQTEQEMQPMQENTHSSTHSGKKTNRKVFISHSTKDANYIEKLVSLFEGIGLQKKHIFCSSVPEYGIPLGQDIYDYLRSEFQESDLYVIFMLSENYYKSAACLNEMGAAWLLHSHYQTILLPDFKFEHIKGAIDPRKVSFRLDDTKERRPRINQLKENIFNYLEIDKPDSEIWERHRDKFFEEIALLKSYR